jgi:hypothetical protein
MSFAEPVLGDVVSRPDNGDEFRCGLNSGGGHILKFKRHDIDRPRTFAVSRSS